MLRIHVQTPDLKTPLTEIAYANMPFVNYESIKKQKCPVKFWYHHPSTKVIAGAQFLQTPDGKLCCRIGDGKVYSARGPVSREQDYGLGRLPDQPAPILSPRPAARFLRTDQTCCRQTIGGSRSSHPG